MVVNVYSDNTQMTSTSGNNKDVRYEAQTSNMTDVLRKHTHGQMESNCLKKNVLKTVVGRIYAEIKRN